MTARDAVELCGLIRPRRVIPVHYEGWKHFTEDRSGIEREISRSPEAFRTAVRVAADRNPGRCRDLSRDGR
jgi:L-ascorbate metabolism protein UlaG (beta-lactamase superfamily)